MSTEERDTDLKYLKQTIHLARSSPPKPTNFRVGCVILSNKIPETPEVLTTGFTLELPGNTHAEQNALSKLTERGASSDDTLNLILTPEVNATLYSSLEPCGKRLSENLPCVQRIIQTRSGNSNGGIRRVVFGAKEPGTFVKDSKSCQLLTEAGVDWDYIPDFEQEILDVAMEGHKKEDIDSTKSQERPASQQTDQHTSQQHTSQQHPTESGLPKRLEGQPINRKKRMMEAVGPEPSNN